MRNHGLCRCWLPALGLLAFPGSAQAHTSVQGLGDFISGLLHPVVTPSHLLLVLGLGLMAGRRSPPDLKRPMAMFIPLTALALGLTATGGVKAIHPALLNGVAVVIGILLALEKQPSMLWTCVLFSVAALALGFDSGIEAGTTGTIFKTLLGSWLGLMVLVYDIAIYASLGAERPWVKIALRIAGAWLVAIGVMMLAFALRPPAAEGGY